MIWFGRPIEPRREHEVPWMPELADLTDPPLDQDELFGVLEGWQKRDDGWWAQVLYGYPTHGIGRQNYIGWFPASRLRPA
jgi:hypothetical protein